MMMDRFFLTSRRSLPALLGYGVLLGLSSFAHYEWQISHASPPAKPIWQLGPPFPPLSWIWRSPSAPLLLQPRSAADGGPPAAQR